jgi:hypothetical protein
LDLGPTFIRRTAITTVWLGGIAFLAIGVYLGLSRALAFLAGVALGIADLLLLHALIHEALFLKRLSLLAIHFAGKFVAIYGLGAIAIVLLRLSPWYLLAGFSIFLVVAILKVLGRLVLSTRWLSTERDGAGGPFLRNGPGGRRLQS